MGEKEITKMLLKVVDLQCHRCYKKVKKVLCKFPEIHDQIFDEKKNTVTITVVSCYPEKIMRKIRSKGGDCILSIEIIPPPPPPPPPSPPPPPPDDCKKKVCTPVCQIGACCRECSDDCKKKVCTPVCSIGACCRECSDDCKKKVCTPVCPPVCPIGACCWECSKGVPGGSCFQGHCQPRPCYVDCGRPVCVCYGASGWYPGCQVSRCDLVCEEYPSGCTVM